MSRKPAVVLCVLAFVVIALPIGAQMPVCDPDLSGVDALVGQAKASADANDSQGTLTAIEQLLGTLETIHASCSVKSADGVGDSRTNPVPIGQSKQTVVGSFDTYPATIQVVGFNPDAAELVAEANMFNEEPTDAQRWVIVEFNLTCDAPPDQSCEFTSYYFHLVGDKGQTYDSTATGIGDTQEYFGGATDSQAAGFLVDADDSNFVLFHDADDSRVFYKTS